MLDIELRKEEYIKEVDKKLKFIDDWMLQAPEGQIEVFKKKGKYYWYQFCKDKDSGKKVRKYIKKSERDLAKKLALKKYFRKALPYYQKMKLFLTGKSNRIPSNAELLKLTSPDSPYYELLYRTLHSLLIPDDIKKWMDEPYEKSQSHPEHLTNVAASGELVRSKSEVNIMDALDAHGIPYRYECKLTLGDVDFYPDFTIKHPKTGKIFYWEHFGKMDDDNYRNSTFNKIQLYYNNGYFPSINMIVTFEDSKNPLSSKEVHGLIKTYFL